MVGEKRSKVSGQWTSSLSPTQLASLVASMAGQDGYA